MNKEESLKIVGLIKVSFQNAYKNFTDKDKRMIRNKIKYIDDNFTLLTADEMKEIFDEKYKW